MLVPLTLVAVGLVVAALAGYLIAITFHLNRARKSVAAIADGLEAVAGHTEPLGEKLTIVNGALSALLETLARCDAHLGRAAAVFGLRAGK